MVAAIDIIACDSHPSNTLSYKIVSLSYKLLEYVWMVPNPHSQTNVSWFKICALKPNICWQIKCIIQIHFPTIQLEIIVLT